MLHLRAEALHHQQQHARTHACSEATRRLEKELIGATGGRCSSYYIAATIALVRCLLCVVDLMVAESSTVEPRALRIVVDLYSSRSKNPSPQQVEEPTALTILFVVSRALTALLFAV